MNLELPTYSAALIEMGHYKLKWQPFQLDKLEKLPGE